jgi:hypothetical protein
VLGQQLWTRGGGLSGSDGGSGGWVVFRGRLGAGCGGGFGFVRVKMEKVGGLVVWCGE